MERFSLKESLLCGCFSCFHFKQQQTCSPTDMATRCLGQRANHSDEHRHSKYGWRSSPRVLWPRRDLGNTAQLETGKIWDSNQSEAAGLPLICSFVAGIILAPKKWHVGTTVRLKLQLQPLQLPSATSTPGVNANLLRPICFAAHLLELLRHVGMPKQLSHLFAKAVAICCNWHQLLFNYIQIMTFCNRPLDSLDQSGSYVSSEILMWF